MSSISMEAWARKNVRDQFPHLLRLSREDSDLGREASAALAQMHREIIDPVTKLTKRTYFFTALHQAIEEVLPDLETSGFTAPKDAKVTVVVGDVAALAMHNARSPKHGDLVLRRAAIAFMREFRGAVASRIGGDELGVLAKIDTAEAFDAKEVVFADVARYPDNRLDLEIATFGDVAEFLRLYPLPKERRTKFVATLLVDIAMNRAQVMKYWRSTQFLASLWGSKTTYKKISPYFVKGAGNITPEEVEEFSRLDDAELSILAMEYALKKKEGQMVTEYEKAVFKVSAQAFSS